MNSEHQSLSADAEEVAKACDALVHETNFLTNVVTGIDRGSLPQPHQPGRTLQDQYMIVQQKNSMVTQAVIAYVASLEKKVA